MADYCCNANVHELDVDVHRWLPSEILGDIGVIVDTAERRRLAVVEDITARLADVLGGSTVESTHHHAVRPSNGVATTNSILRRHAPPVEAWPFLSDESGRMLDLAVPLQRFAPARQRTPPQAHTILPSAARRSGGGGTGVFLPRTVAYNGTTSSKTTGGVEPPPPRHSKQQCRPSRQQRRHGDEHEAAWRPSRRQLHNLHAHTVSAATGAGSR